MKRKFLILICMILFIVSVVGVSAAEDVNQTITEDTNNVVSNVDTLSVSATENTNQTIDDDALSVSEDVIVISEKDDGTFTALQEKINNAPDGAIINLENDYKYDEDFGTDGIYISGTITINGNGHTIDALNKSMIFDIGIAGLGRGYDVYLNDIQFHNAYGSAIFFEHYDRTFNIEILHIAGCSFLNSYSGDGFSDGVISSSFGDSRIYIAISDCSFLNNLGNAIIYTRNCDGVIRNCSFIDNSANRGVIFSDYRGIDICDCNFVNNSGQIIHLEDYIGIICNCSFTDNSVHGLISASSGNINISDCSFLNNSCFDTIDAYDCVGIINNCCFMDNSANSGGAIGWMSGDVDIVKCSFTHNSANYGGAVGLYGSNVNIDDCNFTNNQADYGGAIYNDIRSNLTLKNSDISYNTIYFENYLEDNTHQTILLSDLNFSRNNDYEGLISMNGSKLLICRKNIAEVTVDIAGKTFKGVFTDNYAVINLQSVGIGTYDAKITYWDNEKLASSLIYLPITVESSTNLEVPDVTKDYGGPERLEITLTESGSPIANADVNININDRNYDRVTDAEGKAYLDLNLIAGNYNASVTYDDISTVAKVTINQLATTTTISYKKNSHNSVTLTALVNPATAGGNVVFTVNGKDYAADKVVDGKATHTLSNLAVGNYEVKASYKGDVNHKASASGSVKFTVEEVKYDVSAPDLTKYYHGPEKFVVTVKEDNVPLAGKDVTINLNGKPYTRTTDSNGQASMAINLNSGVYNVTSQYEDIKVDSTITVKSTVSGSDVTKIFKNGTQYYAKFVDTKGNLMKNTDVKFNINGVFYTRTTDDNGVAKMNINLPPETYVITAENPDSTEMYTNVIKVLPSIVENYDLTKYYKNASKYTLKIIGGDGNPVGEGVVVKLNINGVFYERKTNASGYMSMNINLPPGTYTVTAEYNGLKASNTINVLSILETKDLSMKFRDGSKFEAKILDGQGKPYVGQTVSFNINGVLYHRTTGDDGVARLTINLMAGEYIITSMFNGLNAANKVTISG